MTTPLYTMRYTYGDASWGDLLTAYNGVAITYDEIGNPLSDGTWTYTWEHGRQMASMPDGTNTWDMTYNANGLRTGRTDGTNTYTYWYNESGQLVRIKYNSLILRIAYGASGLPISISYNGNTYYYVLNQQGDVMALLDSSGNWVVKYTYDAWGNILTTTGSTAGMRYSLAVYNPLRYRGYVYDRETGLYYLQSRYYNPEIGRFINADSVMGINGDLNSYNLFAYCGNNPANYSDHSGYFWKFAIVGACVNVCTTFIAAKVTNQDYSWKDAGVAALSGAANAVPGCGPLLSGGISGIYAGYSSFENGATLGESLLSATVSGVCTSFSISNIANALGDPALDLATSAFTDLVFGTGYNTISAATSKAIMENNTSQINDTNDTPVPPITISPFKPVNKNKFAPYNP